MSLLELFVEVDDFCQEFERWAAPQQLPGKAKRGPVPLMSASEIMTIVIHFHQAGYRDFKHYYQRHVCEHLFTEFPRLVSYGRFVELMPSVGLVLCAYLQSRFGRGTGITFVDSTPVAVCHNRRIARHRVFRNLAARGRNTMGWFYGFKLHLIVNDLGELLAVHLTPGNVDDRKPLEGMTKDLYGKLFGDKGYLSQALFETLYERGLELVTSLRKNMKNQLMLISDRLLLRKRFIIETITDQLKNISQIEHTRHRSPANFAVNLLAGLIAYTHQPKNPSLHLPTDLAQLPALI
ncbi:MAG: IS982 family transposase [Deinococcota bacterium]|nr:IS982 family transposase [Deinococcota bacterium]